MSGVTVLNGRNELGQISRDVSQVKSILLSLLENTVTIKDLGRLYQLLCNVKWKELSSPGLFEVSAQNICLNKQNVPKVRISSTHCITQLSEISAGKNKLQPSPGRKLTFTHFTASSATLT